MKTKKNIDDKMPTEDAIPAIIHSAKLLARTIVTCTGVSLGTLPPNITLNIRH